MAIQHLGGEMMHIFSIRLKLLKTIHQFSNSFMYKHSKSFAIFAYLYDLGWVVGCQEYVNFEYFLMAE